MQEYVSVIAEIEYAAKSFKDEVIAIPVASLEEYLDLVRGFFTNKDIVGFISKKLDEFKLLKTEELEALDIIQNNLLPQLKEIVEQFELAQKEKLLVQQQLKQSTEFFQEFQPDMSGNVYYNH